MVETSVFIPCYNQEEFVVKAIESVLNQTYQNFEIVIVEDGSTDNSLTLIKKLVAKNPQKIRLYVHQNHDNLGLVKTYQVGVENTKGMYIAFLEADDHWERNYLQTKVDTLKKYPQVGVVFSPYKVVSNGFYGIDMVFRQWILTKFFPKNKSFNNLPHLLKKNNVATFSAFIMRRELWAKIPEVANPKIYFFDWWVLAHLSLHALFYVDTNSHIYWRHHKSSTLGRQKFSAHKKQVIEFIPMLYESIAKSNLVNGNDFFIKKKRCIPYFVVLYQKPSLKNVLKFFRVAPLWTVETLLSYWINSIKR